MVLLTTRRAKALEGRHRTLLRACDYPFWVKIGTYLVSRSKKRGPALRRHPQGYRFPIGEPWRTWLVNPTEARLLVLLGVQEESSNYGRSQ